MNITSKHNALHQETYYKIVKKPIYYTVKVLSNQDLRLIVTYKNKSSHVTIFNCTLINIFCTMLIIKGLNMNPLNLEKTKLKVSELYKYIDIVLTHVAQRRNIVSYQNSQTSSVILDYFAEYSNIFIEEPTHHSHYGELRQRTFLFEHLIVKNHTDSMINITLKRIKVGKEKRMESYMERLKTKMKDNPVPSLKELIAQKVNPDTADYKAIMTILNGVETKKS